MSSLIPFKSQVCLNMAQYYWDNREEAHEVLGENEQIVDKSTSHLLKLRQVTQVRVSLSSGEDDNTVPAATQGFCWSIEHTLSGAIR